MYKHTSWEHRKTFSNKSNVMRSILDKRPEFRFELESNAIHTHIRLCLHIIQFTCSSIILYTIFLISCISDSPSGEGVPQPLAHRESILRRHRHFEGLQFLLLLTNAPVNLRITPYTYTNPACSASVQHHLPLAAYWL